MPADSVNRNVPQEELARLLTDALVPSIVEAVYDYEVLTMENLTAVEVISAGTKRMKLGISDARWNNSFLYEVNTYVKIANTLVPSQGGLNWTSKNVEETLSLIDKYIADVIANNRVNSNWSYIEFAEDFSTIVEGRQKIYERETEVTDYKIESRLVLVTFIEGA